MSYENRTALIARLVKVDTALDRVRTSQEWHDGRVSITRGPYSELMRERKEIIKQIDLIDARGGSIFNQVKFVKPT